jgi:signal transduction histidine kinase
MNFFMKKTIISLLLFCIFYVTVAQQKVTDSLNKLLASAKEDTGKSSILNKLCFAYVWTNPDTALVYAQQELLLSKKIKLLNWEAVALTDYGYVLSIMGNYPQALEILLQALRLGEKAGDSKVLLPLYWSLSEVYRDEGDFRHALEYAYKSTSISDSSSFNMAVSMAHVGSIYEKFNSPDSALIFIQRSDDMGSRVNGGNPTGSNSYTLGNIYSKKANYPLALKYYHQGLSIAISQHVSKDVMDICNGIAKTFIKTGQIDSSISYAKKALYTGKSTSYLLGILDAAIQLTYIYKTHFNSDSLIKYMELSGSVKDSLFNQQKITEVQNLSFNEQLRQLEIISNQEQYRNQIKMYALAGVVFVFLLIAFFLWRNNRHRQKAFFLLNKQKQEIDFQKSKVEQTLEDLKSTQSQLIQSEKMASLGELTAGIAHEIQNPLNFVNNFSDINTELIDEANQEIDKGNIDDAKTILSDIKDNEQKINYHGKRADAIVKGMLQHSRSSSGTKEPTDINALTDEYLRLAFHGLRAKDKGFNATMKTDYDESLSGDQSGIGKINIVPQDIGRVVLNLITNAFYAVTEKKKQKPEGYEPTVSVSTKKINNKVEIKVSDNGNGIPQKVLDKIFQPFFTTKPAGQGTGLGLSLSYDIVKAHGGEIKVNTKEGEFTEFVVQLSISA